MAFFRNRHAEAEWPVLSQQKVQRIIVSVMILKETEGHNRRAFGSAEITDTGQKTSR